MAGFKRNRKEAETKRKQARGDAELDKYAAASRRPGASRYGGKKPGKRTKRGNLVRASVMR